ncbi:MAG: electron transfer flavoprotein beta subunit/FixA family protein [Desulfobacteraceae bacterium]|nr:MAG: electron transfer flavoprotein beta subunit/FixA family protein [Desulfobacteraceae bacterium]
MKVVVLIKTVQYVYAQTGTEIGKNYIGPDDVIPIINPLDAYALEFALSLKDKFPDAQITAATLGGSSARDGLKKCLAVGADKAVHVCCPDSDMERFDSWTVAATLSSWMRQYPYDLILTGKQAIDGHSGLAGPYLAEILDLPHVSGVVKLDLDRENKKALLQRAVERGDREILECRLPALFTIDRNILAPRYPTLSGRIKAEKKTIETVPMEALVYVDKTPSSDLNWIVTESISSPKPKQKSKPPAQKKISAADRLQLLMKGGKKERKEDSKLIDADSDKAISEIERILKEHEIVVDQVDH